MRIDFTRGHESRSITVSVEDGPIRPKPYSRTGKQYRVEQVSIGYSRKLDETLDGDTWKVDAVHARGTDLKKDGSLGQTGSHERLVGWTGTDWTEIEWIAKLVREYNPEIR